MVLQGKAWKSLGANAVSRRWKPIAALTSGDMGCLRSQSRRDTAAARGEPAGPESGLVPSIPVVPELGSGLVPPNRVTRLSRGSIPVSPWPAPGSLPRHLSLSAPVCARPGSRGARPEAGPPRPARLYGPERARPRSGATTAGRPEGQRHSPRDRHTARGTAAGPGRLSVRVRAMVPAPGSALLAALLAAGLAAAGR